jgi:hypothetical protein
MSYIDDLVKLRYLVPMREAANSTLSNINTFQSKDIVKDFLDKIQTNPDGTSRPGGASGLDLSDPNSIQKLVGMESGTLSQLLEKSGGQMNTPEMTGIQSISDRILKGMNTGSEMSARAGTTKYQQDEIANKNYLAPSERQKNIAEAGYYNRMPTDNGGAEKNTADQQLQAELQTTTLQSDNPIIVGDRGLILKAVQLHGNTLDNMRSQVAKEYPKMPQSQRESKVKDIIEALGGDFHTAKQDVIDQKNKALEQVKTLKVTAYKNDLANKWESMDNINTRNTLKNIEIESAKKSGENIDGDTADERARTKWMNQRLKESGDPDLMPTNSNNPLELNFKPRPPKGGTVNWTPNLNRGH